MQSSSFYQAHVAKQLLNMKTIGAAIIISVPVYIVAGFLIIKDMGQGEIATSGLNLKLPLMAVGCLVAFISIAIRLYVVSNEQLEKTLAAPLNLERAARRPKTGSVDTVLLNQLEAMSEAEQKVVCLMMWYQTRYILMLAFNESIVLFGLVLAIVNRNVMEMVPFAAASIFLNGLTFLHPKSVLRRVINFQSAHISGPS
jgi:hypothetical protein